MPDRQLEDVLPCAVGGCRARPGLANFRMRMANGEVMAWCHDHRPRDYLDRPAPIVRHIMEAVQK